MPRKPSAKIKGKQKVEGGKRDILLMGIDLGTSHTSISTNNDIKKMVESIVGWPKDAIAKRFINKDVVFGAEALKNRLALDIYTPLEKGAIKDTQRDKDAARELAKYIISMADTEEYDRVYGVVGIPSQSSFVNQQTLMDVASEMLDAVLIVNTAFVVAYGVGNINNVLVVDIGAGTVDLARIHGTLPDDNDQISLDKAGDYVDSQIVRNIKERYFGAQVTKDMAKAWKEQHGFVGSPRGSVRVEFPVDGRAMPFDLTKIIQKSCDSIISYIISSVKTLVATYDPEFQEALRNNILLAGGGSQIPNLAKVIETQLIPMGGGKVKRIDDPFFAAADGALKLAQDMPVEYWQQLM